MTLQVENLNFSYDSRPVLQDIRMQARPGEITALIGPNAAGKSTFLKCLCGILKPEGKCFLNGKEMRSYKKEMLSRYISYLPQETSAQAVLTVFEVVLLGRLHSLSWRISNKDRSITLDILQELGLEELALRYINELSGGQKQTVFIAQALIKEPEILLLDEPTNSLDLQHQLEIFELIKDLTVKRKITTIIALHDLNMAAKYADNFVILRSGEIYSSGRPEDVLTDKMLKVVYRVNARIRVDDGIFQVTPISSIR